MNTFWTKEPFISLVRSIPAKFTFSQWKSTRALDVDVMTFIGLRVLPMLFENSPGFREQDGTSFNAPLSPGGGKANVAATPERDALCISLIFHATSLNVEASSEVGWVQILRL